MFEGASFISGQGPEFGQKQFATSPPRRFEHDLTLADRRVDLIGVNRQ